MESQQLHQTPPLSHLVRDVLKPLGKQVNEIDYLRFPDRNPQIVFREGYDPCCS